MRCSVLQCVTVCCSLMQRGAVRCSQDTHKNVLRMRRFLAWWRFSYLNALQQTATHCNPLHCNAVVSSMTARLVSQHTATHCTTCDTLQILQDTATRCDTGVSSVTAELVPGLILQSLSVSYADLTSYLSQWRLTCKGRSWELRDFASKQMTLCDVKARQSRVSWQGVWASQRLKYCNTLQHPAAHCHLLELTATHMSKGTYETRTS